MDKHLTENEVEVTLHNFQTKPLDKTELQTSQSRVWQKVSSSIDVNNVSHMSLENSKPSIWAKLSLRQKMYLGSIFVVLGVFLVVGVVSFQFFQKNSQSQSGNLAQNPNTQQNSPGPTDFKALAALRFQKLTGVSYDTYKSLRLASSNTNDESSIGGRLSAGSSSVTSTQYDTTAISQLVQENKINDNNVFYNESEVFELPGRGYANFQYGPSYDPNQPVNIKHWYSANYSKYVTTQNRKLLNVSIYTPEYFLQYMGGDYAVKQIYSNKNYFNGVGGIMSDRDTEISFVKSMLEDNTLKDLGKQVIDSKEVQVFESAVSDMFTTQGGEVASDAPVLKTQYFVDLNSLELYQTLSFENDKLVSSSKTLDTRQYENASLDQYFHANEVGSKEIKSVEGVGWNDANNTFSNVLKKYPIYYLEKPDDQSSVFDYGNNYQVQKLITTRAFNPNLTDEMVKSELDGLLASYTIGNIRFTINALEFDTTSSRYLQYQNKKNINITVNGKSVGAVFYEPASKPISCDDSKNIYCQNGTLTSMTPELPRPIVLFQSGSLWYELTMDGIGDSSVFLSKPLVLQSLSAEEAQEIDVAIANRISRNSIPPTQAITFDNLPQSDRLLPGDLSKTYNLKLTGLSNSSRDPQASMCMEADIVILPTAQDSCYIEKFAGFTMMFSQVEGSQNSYISVFKTDIKTLNLPDYIKKYNEYQAKISMPAPTYSIRVVSPTKTVLQSADNQSFVYLYQVNDRVVFVNSSLSETEIDSIVQGMDIDKDLALLKDQLAKN